MNVGMEVHIYVRRHKHHRKINLTAHYIRRTQELTRNDISRESSRFKIHEPDTRAAVAEQIASAMYLRKRLR